MRIGIVNDIKMTAEVLRRIVTTNPNYQVAWIAYDGADAVQKCASDIPDLILMDLIMPVMGGVEATQRIMKHSPCPILVVTASVTSNSSKVFEAMGYGALDVVKTPTLDTLRKDLGGGELLSKIDRILRLTGKTSAKHGEQAATAEVKTPRLRTHPPLLVVGASTGGPGALATLLAGLPSNIPIATVLVQHVDEQFAPGLANWLGHQSGHRVKVVEEGEELRKGKVFLSGRNDHLILKDNLTLGYTEKPVENPYRPSVDVFFRSVAEYWPVKSIAVLLTGMGSDGAKGLKALHDLGWHTVVQDEASSVVFGMPKAAIELGAARKVLPLDKISCEVIDFFQQRGHR